MTTKVCRACKEEKPIIDFYASKSDASGFQAYCKTCARKERAAWRKRTQKKPAKAAKQRAPIATAEERRERRREYDREYRAAHQEKLRERWRQRMNEKWKNDQAFREQMRARAKDEREGLSGRYVKGLLVRRTTLESAQIEPGIVEMKRQELLLKRCIIQLDQILKEKKDEH